jgi:LacI family transcriptional regulator
MATVADVAKRAGVSVSTAARVLAGSGYAAEETRRLVTEAARELGYVPNQIARSLRTNRTRTVGLLVGDVENPFYSAIARHVEAVAKDAGYHVVLCNSDDDPRVEREYLRLLEGMRVDALIVTPTSKNRRRLAELMDKDIVIVQVDRQVDGLDTDPGRAHPDRDLRREQHPRRGRHDRAPAAGPPRATRHVRRRLRRRAVDEHRRAAPDRRPPARRRHGPERGGACAAPAP